jgi:hypothetical protein
MKPKLVVLLSALAVIGSSGPLAAQPPAGSQPREERQDRAEERQKRREERREQRKDRAEDRKDRAEDRKDRAEHRRERRRQRAEELRARYGRLLAEPAVQAELKIHARRMARLHQLRRVAEKEGKTALLPRIDKLIEKERARHQRHMDALNARGAPAASASASWAGAK